MPVTKPEARALANLAIACRPHGARHWDAPGVMAAIERVANLALADVAMAVIRGAADRTLQTPAAIGNTTSSCWRERLTERPTATPPKPAEACHTCGRHRETCTEDHPHTPPRPAGPDAAKAAREALFGRRADA